MTSPPFRVLTATGEHAVPCDEASGVIGAVVDPASPVTWVHAEPCQEVLEALSAAGVDDHALERLGKEALRPRVEEYEHHLTVTLAYLGSGRAGDSGDRPGAADVAGIAGALAPGRPGHDEGVFSAVGGRATFVSKPLTVFLGPTWVVSLGDLDEDTYRELVARVNDTVLDLGRGASFILYVLTAWSVETFLPVFDELDFRIDQLEDTVLKGTGGTEAVEELFRLKQDLVELRRMVTPLRGVTLRLATHDAVYVEPDARVYFRDVLDDVFRLLESLDIFRDVLTTGLDLYLSSVSNRLNDVMKRLTVVATIFLPLTFVVGLFGTNFPQMRYTSDVMFWIMIVSLVVSTIGMVVYFRLRHWW